MNISFYIAKRYLFSKKTHNTVNLISLISVCGIAIATMAMVCTLSVFNGFQDLVANMFSSFDPELKITALKGKTFDSQSEKIKQIEALPELALFTEALEDNVLIRYKDRQVPATLKGVSNNYEQLTHIQDVLIDGKFKLADEVNNFATLGVGLAINLGVNASFVFPFEIFAPRRTAKVNMANPASSFTTDYAYISSVFRTNQAVYDDNYLIVPIALAKSLFEYENEISSLEVKLKEGVDLKKIQAKIEKILGPEFRVQDRYQQQEATFKMMNLENWIAYLIVCFIVVLAVFNIISSLSMLVIEKKDDVLNLRNLGANNQLISRIFLFEGWMISIIGAVSGLVLGLALCLAQQKFGWLKMGNADGTFVIDAYPLSVAWDDVLFTLFTVLVIGLLAVIYPVRYLSKKWLK